MLVEEWRFIDLDLIQLEKLHGIEEVLAKSRRVKPTILFWRANKPVLTLGYFARAEDKLNLEKCWKLGIWFVRRLTGGSVGPLNPNILSYSLIVNEDNNVIPEKIEESYQMICDGIVKALKKIGLNAYLTRISDVEVEGRKVSGNAQTRVWGKILQHGFIYLELDLETFKSLLNVEKLGEKKVYSLDERVTWVNRELKKVGKKPLTINEFKPYLKKGFEEALNVKLRDDSLTSLEEKKAEKYAEKFFMDDWNLKPELFKTANKRMVCKVGEKTIKISAFIQNKKIKDILVTGNFNPKLNKEFLALSQKLKGILAEKNVIFSVIDGFFREKKLSLDEIDVEEIVNAVVKAVKT
mgnify:CR=1 FL=1